MNVADYSKKIKYNFFEDNNGALEMAKEPKIRPRTKHVAIKYHYFRTHIERRDTQLEKIDTTEQEADFLTKPLV